LETVIRISIRPAPSSTQSRRQRAREEGSRAARTHRSPRTGPEPPGTHAPSLLGRRCHHRRRRRRRRRPSTPGSSPSPACRPPAPGTAPAQGAAAASGPAPAREAARRAPRPARCEAGSAETLMPSLAGVCAARGPAHLDLFPYILITSRIWKFIITSYFPWSPLIFLLTSPSLALSRILLASYLFSL
jgi:hypothetical protein